MLYDSGDVDLLRWQDKLMAQSGLDIAISSWWGMQAILTQYFTFVK
jgi:hypothetical protein